MANDERVQPVVGGPTSRSAHVSAAPLPSVRTILAYEACELITEIILYFTVIFAPWAFGTTQSWSIGTMNIAGYALALILAAKLIIRRCFNHRPSRWDNHPTASWLVTALVALTAAILAYTLIAAWNARAVYDPLRMDFIFRPHLKWLPHSYDADKTWQALASYLALAGGFWALRDWLLGKTTREMRGENAAHVIPTRLRRLLWVLAINGALLALVAIAQRLDGGGKLLWLVQPRINRDAEMQLGPYAYRANGAQYFNLLWPLALGLWWLVRRQMRRGRKSDTRWSKSKLPLLLLSVLLMAICPIISTSRGGAVIAVAALFGAAALVVSGFRKGSAARSITVIFFGCVLGAGLYLGWEPLAGRLKHAETDLFSRENIYTTAKQITHDYPLFGTGPGSFESVFQLYRSSTEEYWPAQLHNDWLETLITFGWVGSTLIGLAFGCVLVNWFRASNIETGWRFPALIWLAFVGCLIHARFDFPLQVYSILHLFLVECAILMVISRRAD
jgi:hypothetical protein